MEDDEEDVMILRAFLVCLVNVIVLLLFFNYILNVFQRQIVFVFKNITQHFHLYMIYT